MYKWCAKHGGLVMFLWSVPISAIVWVLFLYTEGSLWIAALFTFFIVVSAWGFVNYCAGQLILRAVKLLKEQCDPYPLLVETEELLSYNRFKIYRQILLIDYCVAIRSIGEYDKVLKTLEGINIDKHAQTTPVKVVYYNNLADIYLCLNELEKAEVWQNKSVQILNDLKNKKMKDMLNAAVQQNVAEIAYYKKDYDQSIEILNNIAETNMRDSVSKALLFAEIFIAQNKVEEAKSKLQFVIENGNKLIDVQIAKELMCNLLLQ